MMKQNGGTVSNSCRAALLKS